MSWYGYPVVRRSIQFSRTELRHILLAMVVLTIAFTLAFSRVLSSGELSLADRLISNLLLASIAVPTGFLLHELGHKVVAQRYGCLAEFRSYPRGLFLALITALLGFLFAAPGAVVISGYVDKRQNGRISIAGPLVNLGIGAGFFALWFILRGTGVDPVIVGSMSLLRLTWGVAFINLLLGAFNMMPFPPLDGSKVLRWDLRAYGLLLAAIIGLLVSLYFL
ncbi:MAG: M50 family metallopeptidase [Candidatus Thermoplasmatota archaeon]|nr:M50 family metallopeptidase [Candidatus Thermoplasmatota archaeon]